MFISLLSGDGSMMDISC